jgi:hypothetical protein
VLSPTEGIHEAGIEAIVAIRYSHPIARTPVPCDSYIAPIAQGPKVWPIGLIKSSGRCVAGEGAIARGILDAFRRPDPGCGNAPGEAAGVGIDGIEQRCALRQKVAANPGCRCVGACPGLDPGLFCRFGAADPVSADGVQPYPLDVVSRWAWGRPAFAKPASAGEGRSLIFAFDGRNRPSRRAVSQFR